MTPIPHQSPILIVIGRPIEVQRVADPPPELVKEYLGRFIAELQALFERNKAFCPQGAQQLRIM